MAVLDDALEQAKQGRGAVIGIVAEPGVGKSRLCHEFTERCRAQGIDVYEAQAQAHGEAETWRAALIAEALFAVGRDAEALKLAEHGVAAARDRGLLWALPRALRALAAGRTATGAPGASELLDEAEEVATTNTQLLELESIRTARDELAAASR